MFNAVVTKKVFGASAKLIINLEPIKNAPANITGNMRAQYDDPVHKGWTFKTPFVCISGKHNIQSGDITFISGNLTERYNGIEYTLSIKGDGKILSDGRLDCDITYNITTGVTEPLMFNVQ